MNMHDERPLNENEKQILKRDLKQLEKRIISNKRFLFLWTILAIILGTIALLALDSKMEYYLLSGVATIYILIGLWIFLESMTKIKKQRDSIEYVIIQNKVESLRVNSDKYIELSEIDDEGTHYLFQINDNKILSLGGQDYHPTKTFPSDDFEIVICYGKQGEIALYEKYVRGNRIQPIRKITGEKKLQLLSNSNYPNPEKFTMIEGKLEDIESILK